MNIPAVASKSRKLVIAGALTALAVAGAWYYGNTNQPDGPAYREAKAARGDLEVTILATGMVQPRNRLEIKPPIAGRAERVLVQEGQTVAKGAILAWMSSTERAALIDAARARSSEELKRWEELYRATPILAPIGGTLILRRIEPGQTFTGNDAVFVMSDRLTVKAQVDETDIAQIRPGQKARVVLDAYPDQSFAGRVDRIAYDAKTVNNVTTYEVDVLPEKVPAFMRSGMTANVTFFVAMRKEALLVPSEAVRTRDGRFMVLVASAKGRGAAEERAVETGLSDGKRTEVVSGLAEGETVLVARLKTTGGRGDRGNPLVPVRRKR